MRVVRVFVAGATGTLGRPSVHALIAAGHQVRVLVRDDSRGAIARELGAETIVADLFDAAAVRTAVAGCDAVLHLATRIPPLTRMRRPGAWRANDRLRSEGSAVLVDAALATGARVYVQESITFLYADGGDRWLDETAPTDPVWPLASAADAESATARVAAGGGAGVVLRFALFYAPYAPSTAATIALARRRLFTIIGSGTQYMSAIHVDDAAAAIVAALSLPSGIYNVCDDEPLPMRDHVLALTGAFGFPPPHRVPRAVARVLFGRGGPALLRSQRVANGMLKAHTAWTPRYRSVREGWMAVARQLGA